MRLHQVINIQGRQIEIPEIFFRELIFQIFQNTRLFLLPQLFKQLAGVKISGLPVIDQVPGISRCDITSSDNIAPKVPDQRIFRLNKTVLQMELSQLIFAAVLRKKFIDGRQASLNQSLFLAFGVPFRHASAKQSNRNQDPNHQFHNFFANNLHQLSLPCHLLERPDSAPSLRHI